MIRGGYILQPRQFDSSEAAKMPPVTRELWHFLIRNVNHKDSGQFKRGQGFFCLSDIQEALCWFAGYRKMTYSKPQLTKSLRRLCESNMVETMKATRGVVVTVCNYDVYQDPKQYEGNDGGSTKETRRKREGHTINKNDKNERKKKEDIAGKQSFGEFQNVKLTEDEYSRLETDMGPKTRADYIERLDLYDKSGKYKNHNLTLRAWWKKDGKPTDPAPVAPVEDADFKAWQESRRAK